MLRSSGKTGDAILLEVLLATGTLTACLVLIIINVIPQRLPGFLWQ